jgi:hypothetical protein
VFYKYRCAAPAGGQVVASLRESDQSFEIAAPPAYIGGGRSLRELILVIGIWELFRIWDLLFGISLRVVVNIRIQILKSF